VRTVLSLVVLCSCIVVMDAAVSDEHLATAPHPVTHEDVFLMRGLGTPVPDPDGRLAVVAVTEPAYEEDDIVSDLWLIAVDGNTPPRRLTSTPESEDDAAWSPDGSRLAFSTKRGGEEDPSQIFVIDMTGPGEAIQITSLVTGAGRPRWSPDGSRIAFESRVYPGAADDEANKAEKETRDERKYNATAYDFFPVRQWDRWRDDMQTHLFVQDAEPDAQAKNLFFGTDLVAEPGFAGTAGRASDGPEAEWTPDGEALVFAVTTNLHEAARSEVFYHLYQVSADGGEPQKLTDSRDWICRGPKFSPDGDSLYCQYEPITEFAYNMTRIARFDWPGDRDSGLGTPKIITASFDRSVRDITFSDNSRSMYLTANDEGRVRLFKVSANGGDTAALDAASRGVFASPGVAGRNLVARWEDSSHAQEIVRIDPRNGSVIPITAFNTDRTAKLDRQPFLEFWHESARGRRIHSWVTLPPGFDENERYPLVLLIHGGPFSSSLDADHPRWSPHLLAAPGYVVIQTDYTGSVGYGEEFSHNIQGDPLKTPGEELVEAAEEAIRLYPFIDANRQAAAGASYGGHLVNWLQATTDRFKALVGHAGLISLEGQWASSDVIFHREIMNGGPAWGDSPIWRDQSPSTYAASFSTPILLTIGENDFRVPINQTLGAFSYLNRQNVPARLLVFHEANHWIMKGPEAKYYWEELHGWLADYLGANPTTD